MRARSATSALLLLALAPGLSEAQTAPTPEMRGRLYASYVEALTSCLRTRSEVELTRGVTSTEAIAQATGAFCGPGYRRAVRQLVTPDESLATVRLIAWREAARARDRSGYR